MARVRRRIAVELLSLCSIFPLEAECARPMVTDDARIVDAKSCQVESWVKRNQESVEAWALPACNPPGNLELTFGGTRTWFRGDNSAFTDHVVQAKTIFRPLEPNGLGVGLAVGTIRHPHREIAPGWPGDYYAYVPISKSFADDFWVVHVNAGAVRKRDERRTQGTWGLGNEIKMRDDLILIPEIFGNDRGRPLYQAGLRFWAVKDRVQIDTTYGNRLVSGNAERWISVGLRLLSPPILP